MWRHEQQPPLPMNDIRTKLMGGLGNQMFQYAAGRALSTRTGLPLLLDTSPLLHPSHRQYELAAFHIQAEVLHTSVSEPKTWLHKLGLRGTSKAKTQPTLREAHFHFDPRFSDITGACVLDGYWQSERYFADIAATVRNDFHPRTIDTRTQSLAQDMGGPNVVSLHVRRGDYVTNPEASQHHGLCSMDYYQHAMQLIREKVPGVEFRIFTDDPDWVSHAFPRAHPWRVIEDWAGKPAWVDMWLMSQCSHHIVANSSYSWWGAWLNPSPDKLVVAPARWFKDAPHDTTDLIPASWLRVQ
jgi:hypothetical protein